MGYASAIRDIDEWRGLGRRVRRTGLAADISAVHAPPNAVPLFQVSGGDVQLMSMYGICMVVIAGGAGSTYIIGHTPTGGAWNAMCVTSVSFLADDPNTIYTWPGTPLAGALQPLGVGAVGVGNCIASFTAAYPIVIPGIIGLAVAVGNSTGLIDWIVHYVPLERGATLNAV